MDKDDVLVSFDVDALYPNTPMKESINLLEDRLHNNIQFLKTDLKVSEIISLVKLCTSEVYVENEFGCYKQSHGAPMGGGLSGILSDIYMEYLEEKNFKIYKHLTWYRFRDDTIMKWNYTKYGPIEEFLKFLNNIDPYLKFTYEIENNYKISFLDILITRNHNENNKLTTSVYRKETHSDRYIHYTSNHEKKILINTLQSMVRRAIIYCTTTNSFDIEINHIRSTFSENGYPDELIHKHTSINKINELKENIIANDHTIINNTQIKENKYIKDNDIWLRIPYDPYIWNSLKNLCKKMNIRLGASKGLCIGQILIKRKPICNPLDTVGGVVYKIPCASCNSIYIGETIQKTSLRMTQHKSACSTILRTRKIDTNSDKNDCGTAHHTLNTGHKWNFENCTILAKEKFEKDRKLRESIEIYKHKQNGYILANNLIGAPFESCWHEILNSEKA